MAPLLFQLAATSCIIASHGASSFMPNNFFRHSRSSVVSSASQEATSPKIVRCNSTTQEVMPAGILSDGQMDLSPDNEPSAPPRDGVHLFVLVHGLAGKADDLAYLASQLEAQGGHRVAVLRPTCNEGSTTDGLMAGAIRVAEEVTAFVKARRATAAAAAAAAPSPVLSAPAPASASDADSAPSTADSSSSRSSSNSGSNSGSNSDSDSNSNSSTSSGSGTTGSGAVTSISFVGHSLGGLYARLAAALLFDPVHGTVAGLVPESFVTVATPHLGVRRFTYVPTDWVPDLGARVLSRLVAGQTGLELFLADEPAPTSDNTTASMSISTDNVGNDDNDDDEVKNGQVRSVTDSIGATDSIYDANRSNESAEASAIDGITATDQCKVASANGVPSEEDSDGDNWADNAMKWTQDAAKWVSAAIGPDEKALHEEDDKDEDNEGATEGEREEGVGNNASNGHQGSEHVTSGDEVKTNGLDSTAESSGNKDGDLDGSIRDHGDSPEEAQQKRHQEEVQRRLSARQVPLLYALTTEPICLDALCAFKRRVAYGLVAGDFLVPAATALFDLRHHFDLDADLDLLADLALEDEEDEESEERKENGVASDDDADTAAAMAVSEDVARCDAAAAGSTSGAQNEGKDNKEADWVARLWESAVGSRSPKGKGTEKKKDTTAGARTPPPTPSPPPMSWWGFEDDKRDRARQARMQRIVRARQANANAAAAAAADDDDDDFSSRGGERKAGDAVGMNEENVEGSIPRVGESAGGDRTTANGQGRRRGNLGTESFEGADFIVWEKPPAKSTTTTAGEKGTSTSRRQKEGAPADARAESAVEGSERGGDASKDAHGEGMAASNGQSPSKSAAAAAAAAVLVELKSDSSAHDAAESTTREVSSSPLPATQGSVPGGEAGAMERVMAKALDDVGWTKVAVRLQLPFAAPRPLVLNRWRSAVASYPKSSEQEKGKKQDKREARNEKGRKEDGAQERGEAQEKDSVAERARAAVLAAASTPNKEEDVADVADRFVKASSSTGVDNDASTTSPPSSAKKSGVPNHGDLEDETSAHFADLQVEDEQAGRWWELTPPLGHNMVVALDRRDGINGLLYDVWQRGRPVMDHAARQLLADLDL